MALIVEDSIVVPQAWTGTAYVKVLADADGRLKVAPYGSDPVASSAESITVADTAAGLSTVPATAQGALVTIETANVRYWLDGSTPTSSAGHLAPAGTRVELRTRQQVLSFKAIRADSTSAKLQVTYLLGPP